MNQIEKVVYVDFLIRKKIACSVCDLSEKLKLSRRQTLYLLNWMRKDLKAPLRYNKQKKQYYFTEPKTFFFGYK